MELDLNKLIDIYGLKGLILSIMIVFITGIVKTQWFINIWINLGDKLIVWFLKSKNTDRKIQESDILNHDIFNYIDFWLYSKVPTFQFSTEYRTVVFRKYLVIFLKCHKKLIFEYAKSGEYKTKDQAELWKSLMTMLNQIVCDYEIECKEAGIPDIVILKMKQKNNESIQLIIDLVGDISNSQFYQSENNYLKIYSIFNIILSVLENTISYSVHVCNSINGQLKGMKFVDSGREVKEP